MRGPAVRGAVVVVCCMMPAAAVFARSVNPFDGDRRGAVVSVGAGGGWTHISSKSGDLSGSTDRGTFVMTFRFGYAPSGQLEIYGFYRASVYGNKLWEHWGDVVEKTGSKGGLAYALVLPIVPVIAMGTDQHLMLGVGSTYYFEPRAHSWFIEAGIGPSGLSDPWELEGPSPFPSGVQTGLGFFVGIGYEFAKHAQADVQFMWSRASWESQGVEKGWTGTSVMLTVAVAGY